MSTRLREFFIAPRICTTLRCCQGSLVLNDSFRSTIGISERVKKVALFHDIGKGYCHVVDEKFNNHFYGHEHAGAYLYMTTVRNQLTERDLIRSAFLIQVHDILRTGNKIIKAFENDPIMMEDLMQLDSIDRAATWRPTTND